MIKDDISDIILEGNEIIQIKKVRFDLNKIEEGISKTPYRGQGILRDDKVENSKLPSIVKEFYKIIYEKTLPSAKKLFDAYYGNHFSDIDETKCRCNSNGEVYIKEGVKGRVYRAYPSLLRDFHFFVVCTNSGLFDNVRYSFITDAYEGIDLMVTYKNVKYGVSLFVKTRRSETFKKKKYKRHNYGDIKEICIEIDPFDKSNYIGDYALYNKIHLDFLIEKINDINCVQDDKETLII